MLEEASAVRGGRPVIATNCRDADGTDSVAQFLVEQVLF
jgi:urease accessory protein